MKILLTFALGATLSSALLVPHTHHPAPLPFAKKPQVTLKRAEPKLILELTPPKTPLHTGDKLYVGFRITNAGNDEVLLPNIIFFRHVFMGGVDPKGGDIPVKSDYHAIPFVNLDTGYADTITLSPQCYWGSDILLKTLGVKATLPGKYKIKVEVESHNTKSIYPERLWEGDLEASIVVNVVAKH